MEILNRWFGMFTPTTELPEPELQIESRSNVRLNVIELPKVTALNDESRVEMDLAEMSTFVFEDDEEPKLSAYQNLQEFFDSERNSNPFQKTFQHTKTSRLFAVANTKVETTQDSIDNK